MIKLPSMAPEPPLTSPHTLNHKVLEKCRNQAVIVWRGRKLKLWVAIPAVVLQPVAAAVRNKIVSQLWKQEWCWKENGEGNGNMTRTYLSLVADVEILLLKDHLITVLSIIGQIKTTNEWSLALVSGSSNKRHLRTNNLHTDSGLRVLTEAQYSCHTFAFYIYDCRTWRPKFIKQCVFWGKITPKWSYKKGFSGNRDIFYCSI